MRVIALLAAYNEARFIGPCLEHLNAHGVVSYVLDNDSTDATVEISERHLGHGLLAIERFPRHGVYSWDPILERKSELAAELEADWFIHADPDEVRLPPRSGQTLAEALTEADGHGYNAVDFQEFTFVPTREAPDHDHGRFAETMRSYYPFLPRAPHRLNAWKRQSEPVDLVRAGGHRVAFPGLNPCPTRFKMRHYLFLSLAHAIEKYVDKVYDPDEVARGRSRRRASLVAQDIRLPGRDELRTYDGDDRLDATAPHAHHLCFAPPT